MKINENDNLYNSLPNTLKVLNCKNNELIELINSSNTLNEFNVENFNTSCRKLKANTSICFTPFLS